MGQMSQLGSRVHSEYSGSIYLSGVVVWSIQIRLVLRILAVLVAVAILVLSLNPKPPPIMSKTHLRIHVERSLGQGVT